MIVSQQPPQPDRMPDRYGSDERTDYQIYDDNALLHQELHALLQHSRALHARISYNDQEIERRKARRRERFNWPAPDPRPAPFSMPFGTYRPTHHLHAAIPQPGRMRIVEAEERRNHG